MKSTPVTCLLAYIDPVSGLIVLQVLVAGVLGAIGFFRRSIGSLFAKMFRRPRSKEPREDSEKT